MNPVKESTAENRVNAESLSTDTTRSLWFEEIVNPFFFVISHNIYLYQTLPCKDSKICVTCRCGKFLIMLIHKGRHFDFT